MGDEVSVRVKNRYCLLVGLGITVVFLVWLFLEPLRSRIAQDVALASPSPPPELVEDIIENSRGQHNPQLAIAESSQ